MRLTVDRDVSMIDKVTRIGVLYDFYGALLTQRQREMTELYYFDDWSLAEISSHLGVSRQAVHDNLRRAEEQMNSYENVLKLVQSHRAMSHVIGELLSVWKQVEPQVSNPQGEAIAELIHRLAMEYRLLGEETN
jgi:predicted DNA-binding protein YlxM (UPF0122 family)